MVLCFRERQSTNQLEGQSEGDWSQYVTFDIK